MTRRSGAGEGTSSVKPQKTRGVEIEAEVRQVKTMADGTVNVTLNLPEYCMAQAQVLLGWVKAEVKAVIQVSGENR